MNPSSFLRKGLPIPNKADPIARRDLLFYSDAKKNRGYLGVAAAKRTEDEVREAAVEVVLEAERAAEGGKAAETKPEA